MSHPIQRKRFSYAVLAGGSILLVATFFFSVMVGNKNIPLTTIIQAIIAFESGNVSHQIVQDIRLPRAVAGVLVGAFLSVSGAVMQGMTRNPIADPSILGVSQGSAFAIALAYAFIPGLSLFGLAMGSFIGAGAAVTVVFLVSAFSKGGMTPIKLALAGTAIGALLSSLSATISIRFEVARSVAFWYAGGLVGVEWDILRLAVIPGLIGLVLALCIARSVTVLAFGDEVAKGLGTKTTAVKIIGMISVLLLTGISVSIAGVIGFVGLIVPHLSRYLVGIDYRYVIPCSAVLGGVLLLLSDIVGRVLNEPFETPVSVVTALVGVPFFLYIARQERSGRL